MSSQLSSELWNEGLKLVSFCPVCETRYNPMEAKILAAEEEMHLLHVRCQKCQHSILALVLVNHAGASSVGLLTDLSYDDVVRVKSNQQISVDDVIETHSLFGRHDWAQRLGTATQKQLTLTRKRIARREKKRQKNEATR